MTFILVAHGNEPIPPTGWGAVEQVIWQHTLQLRAKGHTVIHVNAKKWKAIREVLGHVRSQKIDVVHCHAEKPIRFLALWCRLLGKRAPLLISTTHNPMNPNNLSGSELKALRRCHYAPYHLVLRADIAHLIECRNASATCAVLPNAVEVNEFQTSPTGNGKACYLGRIQERKRQNDTALLLEGSDIQCDFIGPVMEETPISDALRARLIDPWNRDQLHRDLCRYSCLVLQSTSEGQPLVVLEALAAGIPVVISPACTGNLDLTKSFIHVVERDEDLIIAIQRAMSQRDELSPQIREYAASNFDYSAIVDRYVAQVEKWIAAEAVNS